MMTALQATCVAFGTRGLVIEGASGAGKSSLALSLIDRGATLVGDDGILVEVDGTHLIASPHPNTRGLLEVRNLGIVEYPVSDNARLCLVVRLDEDAPRYIDEAQHTTIEGADLPMVRISPVGPNVALKAEIALEKYGLE